MKIFLLTLLYIFQREMSNSRGSIRLEPLQSLQQEPSSSGVHKIMWADTRALTLLRGFIGGSLMLMYFDWELVFLPLRQVKQGPAVQASDCISSPCSLPQNTLTAAFSLSASYIRQRLCGCTVSLDQISLFSFKCVNSVALGHMSQKSICKDEQRGWVWCVLLKTTQRPRWWTE